MNLQRNLTLGLEGADVELLQQNLALVGFSCGEEETIQRFFGPRTAAAVRTFQLVHGKELRDLGWNGEEGVVESITAELLTRYAEWLASEKPPEPDFILSGTVEGPDALPLPQAAVAIFDQDVLRCQPLGVARTDERGAFTLAIDLARFYEAEHRAKDFSPAPDLLFKVEDQRQRQRKLTALTLILPGGIPRAVPRLGPDPGAPFIVMNARHKTVLQLRVAEAEVSSISEFEEVEARLAPAMRGARYADLKEGDGHFQISFLAAEADVATSILERLRAGDQSSRTTADQRRPVPLAAFYGLDATGLPMDLPTLGNQPRRRLEDALQQAIAGAIIPRELSSRVSAMVDNLLAVAALETLEARIGDQGESLHAWLALAQIPKTQRAAFLRATADHEGTPAELWQRLTKEGQVGDGPALQRAKLVFQLAHLTLHHLPLVQALVEDERLDIRHIRDVARLEERQWLSLLEHRKIELPEHLPAGDLDRAAQRRRYAAGLARISQRAFPSAAVEALAARAHADLDLHPRLSVWLRSAERAADTEGVPEFDLSNVHIDRFLAEHGRRIDPEPPETLARDLKRLQRVLLVAREPARIEPLLRAGLDSALRIANIPPSIFLEEHGEALGRKAAEEIHARATSTHRAHLFLHTTLLDYFAGAQPLLMSSAAVPSVA